MKEKIKRKTGIKRCIYENKKEGKWKEVGAVKCETVENYNAMKD